MEWGSECGRGGVLVVVELCNTLLCDPDGRMGVGERQLEYWTIQTQHECCRSLLIKNDKHMRLHGPRYKSNNTVNKA